MLLESERPRQTVDSRLRPNASGMPGVAKSSISSLRMMPVLASSTREPKMRLTVDVSATAPPHWSMVDMCVVPWSSRTSNCGL